MNPLAANPKKVAIFCATFLAVSLTMLGIAGFLVWKTSHFLDRAVSAQGTIIALVPVIRPNQSRTFAARFSFTTPAKQAVTITSKSSSNPPEFEVGESVAVLYLPNNPADARIDSFFQLWGASSIVGGIGTVFLAISLRMILYLRKLAGGPGLDDAFKPG
jgi:hypothetical protein